MAGVKAHLKDLSNGNYCRNLVFECQSACIVDTRARHDNRALCPGLKARKQAEERSPAEPGTMWHVHWGASLHCVHVCCCSPCCRSMRTRTSRAKKKKKHQDAV